MSTHGLAQHIDVLSPGSAKDALRVQREYVRNATRALVHRVQDCVHGALGPLFWGMFRARTEDQREWLYPAGPCEVSIAGHDPIRILIIGDGPAAGCGVRTHDLGIAGHLARHLARDTRRGVVVTVVAQPAASARSTLRLVDGMDLAGYDSIVLMLATTDAFCLTARRSWQSDMADLVRHLTSASAASLVVTTTADLTVARSLTPFGRALTGSHAQMLNVETGRICAQSGTPVIRLHASSNLVSRTYARWARSIGAHLVGSLQNVAPEGAHRG